MNRVLNRDSLKYHDYLGLTLIFRRIKLAVTLRLQRHGSIHRPFYHIVATDKRSARNGKFIEKLGYYDPNKEPSIVNVKEDRAQYWYSKGAQMSPAVTKILKIQKVKLERAVIK